jgi:cytochrome c biogenesis protein CcmG/thiol:disulfide interchange protein DsbE
MTRFWPLLAFAVIVAFLYVGLFRDPREIPSPLIGKPAPQYQLPTLKEPKKILTTQDLMGHVTVINVFASWCVSCRDEHPILTAFLKKRPTDVIGLDYKDTRPEAKQWLTEMGDPYTEILFDAEGRVGIDFGVYGVPETFVIDKKGVIRFKATGPLTAEILETKLRPILDRLDQEAAL